jgi:magnesium-transporting ATPase (P-type)
MQQIYMVLLTDDSSGFILGIEEGRRIFDHLKKCISFSITVNMPEIWPFIILTIGKIPLPVNTILLLAICISTDMFPAIFHLFMNHPN